ncbi:hypothetical protein JCM9279_002743 [Rhodotorula babjevae]
MERTPFVPVRKHKPSNSPPTSPVPRMPRSPASAGGSFLGGPPHPPLGASTAHNRLAPPATSPDPFTPPALLSPPTAAPRIRAKLTPSAAPRRKALPGAERADVPLAGGAYSPVKLRPAVSPSPLLAAPASGGFGAFPKVTSASLAQASEWGVEAAAGGLQGLQISERRAMTGKGAGRDNVLVCVRVRPPAAKLAAAAAQGADDRAWQVDERTGKLQQYAGGPEYTFDSIVTASRNEVVYEEAGQDLVLAAMEGFDAVIFAYGQTASGKTFVLSGNEANPGIIPQAVSDIFTYIRDHPEKEFLLRASYLEIYNESLKDLLDPTAGPLKVRQDEQKRFFVHPLREEVVTTEAQVAALLSRGADNRHVGQTDFNERSSRSHSVFQMTIESRDDPSFAPSGSLLTSPPATPRRPGAIQTPNTPRLAPGTDGVVRMSRLSLIDLAGSEQATSQMERRSEGAFINKSLLTLEKVIASLTSEAKQKPHVPYRDSKLTQILQPSLSGDARVAVIATMNPSPSAIEETKSTLKFAQRVKKVVLKAVQHEVVDDKALITKYRSHIAMLEAQLKATLDAPPGTPSQADLFADHSRKKQADRVHDLERQVEEFRSLFLTSQNIEKRRLSALPPRPVSPVKMMRPSSPSSTDSTLQERVLDLKDELSAVREERDALSDRVAQLEADRLAAAETSTDARLAELTKENHELLVIARNADVEGELRRQERKFERTLERHKVYQEGLEATLEQERKRVAQFERFILQHLASQTDLLAGRRRSSAAHLPTSASVTGFVPLMAESPDLDAISPDFVELDDLQFSKQGLETIKRSGSRLF